MTFHSPCTECILTEISLSSVVPVLPAIAGRACWREQRAPGANAVERLAQKSARPRVLRSQRSLLRNGHSLDQAKRKSGVWCKDAPHKYAIIAKDETSSKAASNEAPILVAAPHATFVDSLAIVKSRAMPVAKAEFERIPFLGKIGLFMQVD